MHFEGVTLSCWQQAPNFISSAWVRLSYDVFTFLFGVVVGKLDTFTFPSCFYALILCSDTTWCSSRWRPVWRLVTFMKQSGEDVHFTSKHIPFHVKVVPPLVEKIHGNWHC